MRSTAFTYDNALALIALVACRDVPRAARIGEAFLIAASVDRTFHDGRLRNAYRAGHTNPDGKPMLPGWWDEKAGVWAEDAYQDGSSSGNVAWGALAMLTLHEATHDPRALAAAGGLLRWVAGQAGAPGTLGFAGGVDGFDGQQAPLTWSSTEHNVDIAAAATWYDRASRTRTFAGMARSARRFVEGAFMPEVGCFRLGTTPAGAPADPAHLALDTQLWPLLLDDPAPAWRASLPCTETRFGVPGGFDFDNDRDGIWVEGTAQAALVFRAVGQRERAAALLKGLRADLSGDWLYATRAERLTTGLKIGPASKENDFFYFRRPHLGATAWAALAGLGWNPFAGAHLP